MVSTPLPALDLGPGGREAAERPVDVPDGLFNDLCLWLQCPAGSLGPIGWPVVLIPDAIDCRFRFSEDALQVYHRVTWRSGVPRGPFTAGAEVSWVSSRGESVEVGVTVRAVESDGGGGREELASSLVVVRSSGRAESWGRRDVPSLPGWASLDRRLSLVVDETQVELFARFTGARYPLHTDARHAWSQGFPNVLVQGLALVLIQLHHAGMPAAGRAETWFRRAVPAGTLLELGRPPGDPATSVLRLAGTGEVAAVTRLSTERSVDSGPGAAA